MPDVLAAGDDAVVTGNACAKHLAVVYTQNRTESRSRMTHFAIVRCRDMCRILALRNAAVVTTHACARYAGVIKANVAPYCGHVTVVTHIWNDRVVRAFATGGNSIVTALTSTKDVRMIYGSGWTKHVRGMAVFAVVTAENMARVFARCGHAVVARHTVAHDAGVVKSRAAPRRSIEMAVVALCGGGNVTYILPRSRAAFVTGLAPALGLRGVHETANLPRVVVVTNIAVFPHGGMICRHRARSHIAKPPVTTVACSRCAVEPPIDVTRCALDVLMCPKEHEARHKVIEIRLRARESSEQAAH